MRSIIFALALFLVASVALSEKIWEFCGNSDTDTLELKNIQVSPDHPVAGQTFKVAITGTLNSPIADGKAHVLASYSGIKLYDGHVSICQAGLTCPVGAGPFNLEMNQKIPELAPIGGPYAGKIVLTDQAGAQITCIAFKFEMQAPLSENNKANTAMVNDPAFIDEVNSKAATWKAGHNEIFDDKTIQEARQFFLGTIPTNDPSTQSLKVSFNASGLPASFDARQRWPSCIHPIRNQLHCGSCWAFGSAGAFSDRLCISSNGTINKVLSPQFLVSCNLVAMGCGAGALSQTWQFLKDTGISTDECYPYTSGDTGDRGTCKKTCADGSPIKLYRTKNRYSFEGEQNIMADIYANGPVSAGFLVYNDFFNYKSGIYERTSSARPVAGHTVKLIGWGVDSASKTKYWIAANSWGSSWGMSGYFFMKKGSDECYIESGGVETGTPDV